MLHSYPAITKYGYDQIRPTLGEATGFGYMQNAYHLLVL